MNPTPADRPRISPTLFYVASRTAVLGLAMLIGSLVCGAPRAQDAAMPSATPWDTDAAGEHPAFQRRKPAPLYHTVRLRLGYAGDAFTYDTDQLSLDDEGDATLLRLHFEGVDKRGRGLGIRFEGLRSSDDLFEDAGFVPTQVDNYTAFGHATNRLGSYDVSLPLRVGVLANLQRLEEQGTPTGSDYLSFGPYVELAPEYLLVDNTLRWSVYGEFGTGIAFTTVEVDNDPREYQSWSIFLGAEVGTRVGFGSLELSAAYVARWQRMDQSGYEEGQAVFAYQAEFHGVLLLLGVNF